ncbi:hypothetical protein FOMG_07537 [Fusarium oxysporum f. sp. melonis 26406]|uniref:Uncharacterized protein n=1 Tax=Fusarium oxysporum f. sp. melonis 26406 TaxID=1089452 RepID=X0B6L7_FUSOX|nr:hypothetical protein FOMG_07537 [Fusarium oxysporum f. sp. melonis 26406]
MEKSPMKSMGKNQMDYLLKAKSAQMISLPSLDRIRPIILDTSWQSILTTISGGRQRPYDTVKPLADALGLKVHKKIERDDYAGAASEALSFKGPGNVLLCWEHHSLEGIAKAIGIQGYAAATGWTGEVRYPGDRFDLIWVVPPPYTEITVVGSEQVPGLDDGVHVNANGDVSPPSAN